MATVMARLPASATAGDRQQVHHLPEDSTADTSNDSILGKEEAKRVVDSDEEDDDGTIYRPGPTGENDQGWSEGFSFGTSNGPDWIRFAPLSIPSHRRLQTAAVLFFPLLLPISLAIFFLAL